MRAKEEKFRSQGITHLKWSHGYPQSDHRECLYCRRLRGKCQESLSRITQCRHHAHDYLKMTRKCLCWQWEPRWNSGNVPARHNKGITHFSRSWLPEGEFILELRVSPKHLENERTSLCRDLPNFYSTLMVSSSWREGENLYWHWEAWEDSWEIATK